MALGSWVYLSWLFVNRPLEFLLDYRSSLYVSGLTPAELAYWSPGSAVAKEVLAVPLYLAVGLLTLRVRPRRLLVYISPVVLLMLGEAAGVRHPPHFAMGVFLTMALAAVPRRRPGRAASLVLLLAVALQLLLGMSQPGPLASQQSWWRDLWLPGPEQRSLLEVRVGEALRQAPPRSILAYDVTAFRWIARAGTARPFLLPSDSLFDLAEEAPGSYVGYVLVATGVSPYTDPLSARYSASPPPGFLLEATFDGWRLYRRQDVPPLLNGSLTGQQASLGQSS